MDTELTILRPDETASPYLISRKTKIPLQIVTKFLMELAYESLLDVRYIIFCKNYDQDLVHGFEFNTKKELKEFIVKNGSDCPQCNFKLNTENIRVAFVKKSNQTVLEDFYGSYNTL
ncbi:hypothetical protein P4T20_05225 [Aneurinibacillus thermoaerophilus]|uniref:hypothetical protein n=1 Tax=Aneurinibacillus thermoaerophilus TaxID=143495 RepID=UPI002E229FA4|nr:hypothetical protein [Aneurinibacillus thermoaerophilus]